MRAECIRTIEEIALSDPKVVVIGSDAGAGFMPELEAKYPERRMLEGICEQGLVGVAAGLASEGFYPFIIMIAVFGTRRCYEQLLLDFGLHQLSGCMVGVGGGFPYSLLGPTHIAVDDLLLFSAIPGSSILSPAEPDEAICLAKYVRNHPGISYMRLGGTDDPLGHPQSDITFGKGRLLGEPAPIMFISCGSATLAVQRALEMLKDSGIRAGAVHLHTVKPLDVDLVRNVGRSAKAVICVEEHRQIGGLASAILHAFTSGESPITPARFVSVGVEDAFPHGYGTYEEMMAHYGISGPALAAAARKLTSVLD